MGTATRRARLTGLALLALLALTRAGCSDDDAGGGGEDAAATTQASEEGTTSTTAGDALEGLRTTIDIVETGSTDPLTTYVTENDVTVDWYGGDETYVVVYRGLDLEALGPLCPGNSVETSPGAFEHVSNAPTEDGACEGSPTDEGEVEVCDDGTLVYTTLIPTDSEGTLYGTIDVYEDGAFSVSATSTVDADPAAPAFDEATAGC